MAKLKVPARVKIAMVAPPPAKAKPVSLVLDEVLQLAGNTRAYTVLSFHRNSWRVHFEGDYFPSTVKMINGKWVIVQDQP